LPAPNVPVNGTGWSLTRAPDLGPNYPINTQRDDQLADAHRPVLLIGQGRSFSPGAARGRGVSLAQ